MAVEVAGLGRHGLHVLGQRRNWPLSVCAEAVSRRIQPDTTLRPRRITPGTSHSDRLVVNGARPTPSYLPRASKSGADVPGRRFSHQPSHCKVRRIRSMEIVKSMLDGIGRARIGNNALTRTDPRSGRDEREYSENSVNILHAGRFVDIHVCPF